MSDKKNLGHNSKKDFLKSPVEHIDITSFDSRKIISSIEEIIFLESNEVISICSTGLLRKSFLLLWPRFFLSDIKQLMWLY